MGNKFVGILITLILVSGCFQEEKELEILPRESKIPENATKVTPKTDLLPPILHSNEYEEPIPLPGPITTAGAEDSAFITSDGKYFYSWFTPNTQTPVHEQVFDGVTGIYVSEKVNGEWGEPERVILQDYGKESLDGCFYTDGKIAWFCSARTGYTGLHWVTAEFIDGKWQNWKVNDFDPDLEVGELHIAGNGKELYYHSARPGGKGQYDIWVSENIDGKWQTPENIEIVNSEETDGWPYVTPDNNELWFTRWYMGSPAILRSKRINDEWQEPELIISQFAGESTFDSEGNLYFTHHFYKDGVMIEADYYVAMKK